MFERSVSLEKLVVETTTVLSMLESGDVVLEHDEGPDILLVGAVHYVLGEQALRLLGEAAVKSPVTSTDRQSLVESVFSWIADLRASNREEACNEILGAAIEGAILIDLEEYFGVVIKWRAVAEMGHDNDLDRLLNGVG